MNAAHDIKILDMYLLFGRPCIQKVFPGIKNFAKYKQISNLQRKNILEKKNENETQSSMVKSQLMVYQNEQLL